MINILESIILKEYPHIIESLKEISYDDKNNESLCKSDFISINYEKLLKNELKLGCSVPDMLHFHNGKVLFVEFKNSNIKNSKDKIRLKLKGIEGNYIGLYNLIKTHDDEFNFTDIFKLDINYIIVVSKNKVEKTPSKSILSDGTKYISCYLNNISQEMNLKYYRGTFFSNVDVVTEDVFLEKYIPKLTHFLNRTCPSP